MGDPRRDLKVLDAVCLMCGGWDVTCWVLMRVMRWMGRLVVM